MLCRVTQDRQVWWRVLTKRGALEKETANHFSILAFPMKSMKRQKDMALKDEPPRLVGVHYATKEKQTNSSRGNEETEPRQKQCPVLDVTGNGSKVQCYKEQYCTGTQMLGA